jgi:membrane protein involved in colicin uptake
LYNERKAREEEAERGRLEGLRIQQEQANRIAAEQKAKEDEMMALQARLEAQIEELKNPVADGGHFEPIRDAVEVATSSPSPADQRKAAGEAMFDIIGNITITKNLLDAIVNGNIPYVQYTGAMEA